MPQYEYKCQKCKIIIVKQRPVEMRNKELICKKCGTAMGRRVHYKNQAILFKGSGFFVNDYKNKDE